MSNEEIAANRTVAIYWDFENIHTGLVEGIFGEGAYAKQDNRFKPHAAKQTFVGVRSWPGA